jgi:hypothetical protein
LRKALQKMTAYLPSYEDVDTARLHRDLAILLDAIESGGNISGYPQALRVRGTRV